MPALIAVKHRLRLLAQRAYLKARPVLESVGEVRFGDPGAAQFAAFGPGSRVAAPQVALVNPWAMAIGSDTYIRSYFVLEAYAAPGTVVIRVGNKCHVGHHVRLVAFNGIEVEDLVCIGHGCTVADSVHDWKLAAAEGDRALWDTPAKLGRTLTIKRGAWVGNNCVIAGGITIGEWAIVGPNSVISRDIPARSIIGGNPARVLRVQRSDGSWDKLDDPSLLDEFEVSD